MTPKLTFEELRFRPLPFFLPLLSPLLLLFGFFFFEDFLPFLEFFSDDFDTLIELRLGS